MAVFRKFEFEAIRLMAEGFLSEDQLSQIESFNGEHRYNYTGSGYFLSIQHPCLPNLSKTLSDPAVVGESGEVSCGFVLFLADGDLTLECHTWGAVDVPSNFRELDIKVSTPPVNFVDLR